MEKIEKNRVETGEKSNQTVPASIAHIKINIYSGVIKEKGTQLPVTTTEETTHRKTTTTTTTTTTKWRRT